MNTVLITGVETTVVGSNLAAEWALTQPIVAVPESLTPTEALSAHAPAPVVHCGPAAQSCWAGSTDAWQRSTALVDDAVAWAEAARHAGCPFVMISSDAVFTGPWMFHEENCSSLCDSPEATAIHEAEAGVLAVHPKALVVRTHAFGWSVTSDGWLERRLTDLECRRELPADTQRHATPILATDLAAILARALNAKLSGIIHVAGAERVSPTQFLQRLADEFELPPINTRTAGPTAGRREGFGLGETSLDCRRLRRELGVAPPMLVEGLRRLRQQREVRTLLPYAA